MFKLLFRQWKLCDGINLSSETFLNFYKVFLIGGFTDLLRHF